MMIAENVRRVEATVADACARSGRDPAEISLVAVSKGQPVDAIVAAAEAGLRHFGENRVEEADGKIAAVKARVDPPLTWHMVGRLQSRKVKRALALFDVLQSVDSERLAGRLSRMAAAQAREMEILLQINVSGEASKSGFAGYNWYGDAATREELLGVAQRIHALPNLRLRGLMTMAPLGAEAETNRRIFRDLRRLRKELSESLALNLPALSMGMTDDYEIAIEEGATVIRIGRAIFGARETKATQVTKG